MRYGFLFRAFQPIQKVCYGQNLDVSIIADRQQIAVSTNDIQTFSVNCTGYELVIIGIPTDVDIGTDPDDFKSGEELLKRDPCANRWVLLLYVSTTILIYRLSARIDLISALISFSVSPS